MSSFGFNKGDRVELDCACHAVVRLRLLPLAFLYVVEIEHRKCQHRNHSRGARIVLHSRRLTRRLPSV